MKRAVLMLLALLAGFAVTGGCAANLVAAEPAKDVVCFEAAKLSLTDAIRAAERAEGGRAVSAGYRQDEELGCLVNKPGVYEVTLVSGDGFRNVAVDARSRDVGAPQKGSTILERTSHFLDRIFAHDPQNSARVASAIMPDLGASIAAAEEAGGKALKAYADEKDGKLGISVTLVEDGKTRNAWIDAAAGRPVALN